MWLLIDDIRDLNVDVIARTPDAGKKLLALGGWECVFMDHDLGFDETGYDVTKWALAEGFMPDKVQLVTSNPVGRQNMAKALLSYGYTSVDGTNFKKVG
jgi:hypothetical protein